MDKTDALLQKLNAGRVAVSIR
nr:hypothetical protein [Parendozoicomonas sp. Alg238-R29]